MDKTASLVMIGLLMVSIVMTSAYLRSEAGLASETAASPTKVVTPTPAPTALSLPVSSTGGITGILVDEKSGEPISDMFVFLGVPLSETDLLTQIYGDKEWEPLVGPYRESLWNQINKYIDEFDGKKIIYVLPYGPSADNNLVCERFKAQPDQTGAFSFTDVPPGTYYILTGDSPLQAIPRLPHRALPRSFPKLFPAAASGIVDSSGLIVIQGVVVAYVTTGSVQGGLFKVQAGKPLNVGLIRCSPSNAPTPHTSTPTLKPSPTPKSKQATIDVGQVKGTLPGAAGIRVILCDSIRLTPPVTPTDCIGTFKQAETVDQVGNFLFPAVPPRLLHSI